MPLCGSPLHPASGLPTVLPATQFYQARGRCFWCCKACWCVQTSLRKRRVPKPWPLAIVRAAWKCYWQRQAERARRTTLPPGERWCSRGHTASANVFRAGQHYCRPCMAIYSLVSFYRNAGRVITWAEATDRYARSTKHHSQLRNRLAPPGERWCSKHGGYFVVPVTWKAPWRLSWCNPCRAAYQRERRKNDELRIAK